MKEGVITSKGGEAVLPNGATAIGALTGSLENDLLRASDPVLSLDG